MAEKAYRIRSHHDNESSSRHEVVEHQSATPETWQPAIDFDPRLGGETRERSLFHLQQTVGNQAVQRMVNRSRTAVNPAGDLAQRIHAASSSGNALDSATRHRLQEGFNADLSSVRIHTDDESDRLSESVEAIAFTTGSHIFFRRGAYQPDTALGLRLIAHEAAHAIQQSSGPVDGTPTAGGVSISDPSDSFEQAAEHAADQVMSGAHGRSKSMPMEPPSASSMQQVAVQREQAEEQEENPLMSVLGKVINPFTIMAGEKGLEHLAEGAGYPLVKAGLSELAPEAASWLQLGSGAVPLIGGAFELAEGIHGLQTKSGLEAGVSGAKAVSGGLEMAGGGASVTSTLLEAGGMAAPEVLGTIAETAGPAGAVLGSGVLGWEAGSWLNKNTSAGETSEGAWGVMDKGLTGAAQALGIMGKGENKSALTSATDWVSENPALAAATAPLWLPAALSAGAVAGGAGLVSGLGDLGGRAIDWASDLF
jgi:hypothetical protein